MHDLEASIGSFGYFYFVHVQDYGLYHHNNTILDGCWIKGYKWDGWDGNLWEGVCFEPLLEQDNQNHENVKLI